MSIKKLFDKSREGSRNYADYATEKEAFQDVESVRNLEQLKTEKDTFVPQIDFSNPRNFVKFGSAELYYSGALDRIADYYPYDGSDAEKNEFYNKLFAPEQYILDNLYPRYNGFAILGANGITFTSMPYDGYGIPAAASTEYIGFTGGPHSGSAGSLVSLSPNPKSNKYQHANIYDTAIYTKAGLPTDYGTGTRQSNLKSNFDTGVTVEFWLKKNAFDTTDTEKEVIFDLWNNELSSSADYGRLTIELTGAASGSPFLITVQSGTISASIQHEVIGEDLTTASLQDWAHYAFRFYNSGSTFISKLYVNSDLNDTNDYADKSIGEITTDSMLARIGALMTSPVSSSAPAGAGTLSASIDEFRFWKTNRNQRDIGLNYFVNVGGGANSDISNADLGVYYKFNEGITQTASVDSVVLDYAGRVTNGLWTGYDTNSRNTGSAIVLAGAAAKEYREPVVRKNNVNYQNLKNQLQVTGSWYDANNNASFMNYAPSWVLDAHDDTSNKNLKNISHIVGAYFDKVYLLSNEMPKFKQVTYTTASSSPIPFASHLPTSMGMFIPELFVDASILERMMDRTDDSLFESKLSDIKNLIYLNIYNNLTNIYKSKGTEKAIRNVFRCFNIDDNLIKLNTYNKNSVYEIKNNLQQQILEKSTANFNSAFNTGAVVYQAINSSNAESIGFISGSQNPSAPTGPEQFFGATMEADILFPRFFVEKDPVTRDFTDVSLFGLHTVWTGSADSLTGVDTTWLTGGLDVANFQVMAVRDTQYSSNVYFKLTSSNDPYPLPELTSSTFFDVYDETKWNLSVRIKPQKYPALSGVTGSTEQSYDVIFRGVNAELGVVKNSFEVSGTIDNTIGSAFLRAPKRTYVGARNTNITGAMLQACDVQFMGARYWVKFIDNKTIDIHSNGEENVGITDSFMNLSPMDSLLGSSNDLTNRNTLALSWTFDNVTASNATGNFTVQDYSSGSVMLRDNYGWLGGFTGYQHSGYGHLFAASSTTVSETERINTFNFVNPEQVVASDMINIMSDDDEVLEYAETIPNYIFTVEKSMFNAISDEMLNFFAGAVDFNNVIGDPVNRYRGRYKNLEKLRQAFYERVTTVADVEKYVDYYKWFDDALSTIISQLIPASADFVNDVMNTVESHVLERHKYETKFPTLESRIPELDEAASGYTEKSYHYRLGSSPVPQSPRDTTIDVNYWKVRAERDSSEITSGDTTVDAQREIYRRVINTHPFLSKSISPLFDATTATSYGVNSFKQRNFIKTFGDNLERTKVIKGGVNFEDNKNIHFVYSSLLPGGPIDTEGGRRVPLNVLLSFMEDLVKVQINNDPKLVTEKIKRYTKVLSGRDFEAGVGYKNMKSSFAFPFNIVSASVEVTSGYQREVSERLSASIMLTNLHNDVYGPDMEVPMQGPFTNYAVGGHQSRHIKINQGSDTWLNRPEAWKILLGTCADIPSGAIGMVGPDYPNASDYLSPEPYPDTRVEKAVYYRDQIAKRPVNIRNIRMTTGSTILGNYRHTYDYIQAPGAYANPRHFVENQPSLPERTFAGNASSSTMVRTLLDIHRTTDGHVENVDEYSTAYLTGALNKSVIISRFSAPGGIEVQSRGYQDFRSSEFSVYNGLNNRNLTVIKPTQGPSGTISTPATAGDTTNIQVFDIHGKDYGLYSQLARHTARFGRDSLFVTGTTAADNGPGASYNQLPGFHKVHRNNLTRKEICDVVLEGQLTGSQMANAGGFDYDPDPNNGPSIGTSDASSEALISSINSAGGYPGFSWTGWVKFGHANVNVEENIVLLGSYGASKPAASQRGLLRIYKLYSAGAWKIKAELATQSGSAGTTSGSSIVWQFEAPSELTSSWGHYGVAWTAPADGQLAKASNHNNLTIYYNGVSQSVTVEPNDNYPYYDSDVSTVSNWKNWPALDLVGNQFMCLGGDGSTGNAILSASIDEYTFWVTSLNASQVSEIYNSGVPCDITASNTYTDTAALWDWIRFEVSGGSSQINIDNGNPGSYSVGNRITGFGNQFKGIPITLRTTNNGSRQISDVPSGCSQYVYKSTEVNTICDKNVYDNFNIQHQIPRSSKQYAWITASLVSDNGWVGFTPPSFYVRNSQIGQTGDELVEVYSFVGDSDYGSYWQAGGTNARKFGWTEAAVAAGAGVSQFVPVDTVGLNTNIVESIDTSTNTIGGALSVLDYLNMTFIESVAGNNEATASIFNSLLLNRGGQYGHPSWKQIRNADHPIIRNERANNKFSVTSPRNDDEVEIYDMPPVTNRGMPNTVNFNMLGDANSYTFSATDENERIYYRTGRMNDNFSPELTDFVTPGEQMLVIANAGGNSINWTVYSQQLFPSIRNEFMSYSVNKVGYDNLYWRDNRDARTLVNTELSRERTPTGSYTTVNSLGIYVKQSSWPLDAPADFETRTTCVMYVSSAAVPGTARFGGPRFGNSSSSGLYTLTGSAGELQNVYAGFTTGSTLLAPPWGGINLDDPTIYGLWQGTLAISGGAAGALYSRKHSLQTRQSTKSPYGPRLPYTGLEGALTTTLASASFGSSSWIDTGGGEALWEAAAQAGYITMSAENNATFVSAPSNPWFTDYDTYRQDLKLMAKGYSIIPEYRMSEHMNAYLDDSDSLNRYVGLDLEIPHVTGSNSKEDNSFFTTYSNSEFLHDFLRIKNTSLLNATEIKISCTGAIRFNPYKGFYPAQRTLQMVEEFKNSYADNIGVNYIMGSNFYNPGTGSGEVLYPGNTRTSGGIGIYARSVGARPMFNKLFSPGILYNTIKSGLAVDYPIVNDPFKIRKFDHNWRSDADGFHSSGSWALTLNPDAKIAAIGQASGWKLWDERLPFETMVNPDKYLQGKAFYDMESNPFYGQMWSTASWVPNKSKENYTKIASNFFGSVPSFFLKDGQFTSLQSSLVTQDYTFKGDEVYMMRVKLERSTIGPRTYENEPDGMFSLPSAGANPNRFQTFGGRPILSVGQGLGYPSFPSGSSQSGSADYFQLPQDPNYNPDFKESFTMYSRPSAFGPPVSGRQAGLSYWTSAQSSSLDSFIGINPSFTPPYTNGEAWCDLIFRPSAGTYSLRKIMSETDAVYWRFDAGARCSGSLSSGITRALIPDDITCNDGIQEYGDSPYGGAMINDSSMQLSASFNLFGIKTETFIEKDKFGVLQTTRPGSIVGDRWIIKSKFETPMLNFSDFGVHPISGSNITFPSNYSAIATPRGMWHQFGVIPEDDKGVHISIDEIPKNWLRNHYMVKDFPSVYNNDTPTLNYDQQVKSLADLVGFNTETKTKIGVLKEKTVLREAIVAIPYIIEQAQTDISASPTSQFKKSFVEIPQERFAAAKTSAFGSAIGNSLEAAGASISKQLQKMQKYVLPPQFDFLGNPDGAANPFVMYIFEFEYELDKDDLSYIWQNLAPRDYKKVSFQHKSVAHELLDAELLNETVLEENENLRWMVFKVKQKGQESYWDFVDNQADKITLDSVDLSTLENSYKYSYNWPYDYVSFVEMAKMSAEIKYSEKANITDNRFEFSKDLKGAYNPKVAKIGSGLTATYDILQANSQIASQQMSAAALGNVFGTNATTSGPGTIVSVGPRGATGQVNIGTSNMGLGGGTATAGTDAGEAGGMGGGTSGLGTTGDGSTY